MSSAKPLKTNAKAPPGTGGSTTSGTSSSSTNRSGTMSSDAPPSTAASSSTAASGAISSGSAYSVPSAGSSGVGGLNDITSPHELTAFVENLLEGLDHKFDDMSVQLLERMGQMSARVDALEASIQDIINGDISATPVGTQATGASVPQSPRLGGSLQPNAGVRRSGSAQGIN